ncbi:Dihydroceramide fatty acyl 2-hydroxylase FAH1, partial [Cucurbita argyrosperma subsp. argyrosperma]
MAESENGIMAESENGIMAESENAFAASAFRFPFQSQPASSTSSAFRFTALRSEQTMVAQEFTVDLNKPLVFQVGHLGEAYQDWVHRPIVSKERPRFFKSDFWEVMISSFEDYKIWLIVFLICLNVETVLYTHSMVGGSSYMAASGLLVHFYVYEHGAHTWSDIIHGHLRHLYLDIDRIHSASGNTMHYLIHGCHHKHPMDSLRLVFPPTATAVLIVPIWNLVKLFFPTSMAPALFGGGLLGYVMYDVTHYYLHHGQPTGEMPKHLKKYHMNHHFRIMNKGFGVTSSLWDRAFGTLPASKVAEKTR